MLKRVAIVVLLAMVGTGCHWLRPQPGFGPNLQVRVSPPGAQGARVVDVIAADLPDGTPAQTTVRLDGKHGVLVASGSTLPVHFTFDVGAAGSGPHSFWVQSQVGALKRRGVGFFSGGVRLNQLQALGTHNSYHVAPVDAPWNTVEPWQYFEDPLDVQFQSQGVRQIELDVNVANDGSGGFDVFHIPIADQTSTCHALTDCLTTVKTWSDAHPNHAPIAILLELKDNDLKIPVPYGFWAAPDLDRLDTAIRTVFSEDQMFTPDDLRGRRATLPEAIAKDGWPEINAVRGQVMFMMDNGGTLHDWYKAGHVGLAGRVLFSNGNPGEDDAAFIKRNESIAQKAEIQSLVAQGYVVRTRSDADTVQARANDTTVRDAAIESGAQWVSSDYVVPGRSFGNDYVVAIPGGTPARCNPINSPSWCTSNLIEALP